MRAGVLTVVEDFADPLLPRVQKADEDPTRCPAEVEERLMGVFEFEGRGRYMWVEADVAK